MNPENTSGSDSAEDRRRKHDALIARLLSDPERQEALSWLQAGGPDDERSIGGCETNQESIQLVQDLYDLGASHVLAVNIRSNRNETGQYTGKLVVELPSEPEQRQRLFDWCKQQGDSLGFTPNPDRGESHLFLLLD